MSSYSGATYQKLRVPAASVVANLDAALNSANAAYQLNVAHRGAGIVVNNSLDQEVVLIISGNEAFDLAAGEGMYLSANAINRHVEAGVIAVHYGGAGVQPTSGSIRVTVIK